MQLDKLELVLRPRPANQALDLGYALLRAHAAPAYGAWLALWLPLIAACGALALWNKDHWLAYLILAWWLRALPERAPLYVLSRCVFGEEVTWREALRAWPRQLGGGWFSMLTWRRLFSPMRSLYAPVWQLEGARGTVAAERRRVIGRNGTSGSAIWFGICCALFELFVLGLGFLGFLSLFGNDYHVNPFRLIVDFFMGKTEKGIVISLIFLAYAFAGAVMGPVFTACGFTLYLNRRATLEAWDLEIALRQITAPKQHASEASLAKESKSFAAGMLGLLAAGFLSLSLAAAPQPAQAAQAAAQKCDTPDWIKHREATRQPAQDAQQEQARRDIAAIYDTDELRGYVCNKHWVWKHSLDDKPQDFKPRKLPDLGFFPDLLKIVFIALLIAALAYLAYRFRDSFAGLVVPGVRRRATEIAGLDIRPESLPDDVPAQVLALWRKGELRQALALLYRATISRLVHDDGLEIHAGATEGDCSRLAERALKNNALSAGRLKAAAVATQLWLRAAYANRWPDEAAVAEACRVWGSEFDAGEARGTA
ncbi:MAG: DUF4129 domain-containing protein [Burkholderiaceae bacterium]|nr:DUF4129 domain-containing protein [Burkholderiaceae bacterium]